MPELAEYTGETMDLTPVFNYHRDVEIVKKFLERLTAFNTGKAHPLFGNDIEGYIDTNIAVVRRAMGGIMADDVERQIQITKDFPLVRQLSFHDFEPDERQPDVCAADSDCFARRDTLIHNL